MRCSFGGPQLSERRAAGAAVFPIDAGDLVGRNAIFGPIAPREGDESREGAKEGYGGIRILDPSLLNNPAKLEQIRGLLPNVCTMTNNEQLSAAIASLKRDGMSRSLNIDHLVGLTVRWYPRCSAQRG